MGDKGKFYLTLSAGLFIVAAGIILTLMNSHLVGWTDAGEDSCRAYSLVIEGTGVRVEGPEDIEIDWGRGVAYISAYNRLKVAAEAAAGGPVLTTGGLYSLDLTTLNLSANSIVVKDVLLGFEGRENLRPHGIALWRENGLATTLFFVNRRYEMAGGEVLMIPTIEIFNMRDGGLQQRPSMGTVGDARLCGPNDIAALGPDRFLVTNDHGFCGGAGEFLEELLGQKKSFVMYFEDGQFRKVAEGIGYANGIALLRAEGPDGQTLVLVSATRENVVHIYEVSRIDEGGNLGHIGQVDTNISPDNISADMDGRIYVAGFPNIYRFAAYRGGWFGIEDAPAAALFFGDGLLSAPERFFANKGDLLKGATVATGFQDMRLVMSGFDDKLVICRS